MSGPYIPTHRALKRQKRICLHCDKVFQSVGPGNRICSKCHTTLSKTRNNTVYKVIYSTGNKLSS